MKMGQRRKNLGIAIPFVLMFLVIFSLSAVLIVRYQSKAGVNEFVYTKTKNKDYGTAYSGLERAEYQLRSPPVYTWTSVTTPPTMMELEVDGEDVTITIEDVVWPN